jgi:HEAT repeat protein
MRTRTLAGPAALAAGLLAVTAAAQPPAGAKQPPPANPPATQPTPSPLGAPPAATPNKAPSWPKEIGGKDLNAWLKELKDSKDAAVRDAAVKAIPLFGPDARRPALDPLLAALRAERDPGVRLNVIGLLGTIGAENAKEAEKIAKALALALANSGPGGPTRLHLVRALANYGDDAAAAITEVLSVITDPSYETRRAAAFALGRLAFNAPDPKDPKKGPDLRALKGLANTMLKDSSAVVRLEAVQSMILLGPPAYKPDNPADYVAAIKPFLDPVLVQQKVEDDKGVQIWLQVLVMRYDGSQLTDLNIAKISGAINSPDPGARFHALTALAMLGEKAKPAVPVMAAALRFDEPELVLAAVEALKALGEHARQALPELERLKAQREAAKDELGKMVTQEAIDVISGKKKPMAPPPPPMPPKGP